MKVCSDMYQVCLWSTVKVIDFSSMILRKYNFGTKCFFFRFFFGLKEKKKRKEKILNFKITEREKK